MYMGRSYQIKMGIRYLLVDLHGRSSPPEAAIICASNSANPKNPENNTQTRNMRLHICRSVGVVDWGSTWVYMAYMECLGHGCVSKREAPPRQRRVRFGL